MEGNQEMTKKKECRKGCAKQASVSAVCSYGTTEIAFCLKPVGEAKLDGKTKWKWCPKHKAHGKKFHGGK